MKRVLLAALIGMSLGPVSVSADDLQPRVDAARAAAKELMEALRTEVEKAAQAGGAVNAIGVCHEKAPEITARISANNDLEVRRTSHKLRNPDNAPDAWEAKVLEQFQQRKVAGEDLAGVEHHEVVEMDGRKILRYMKAIPMGGVCANCHGAPLKPDVAKKLDELYPQDQARGFIPGDLRGAFTVKQPL